MARIRSIHPGLFTDEAFMDLSTDAQIFWIGLWTECDDQGAFEWKPGMLRARLRPTKDGDVSAILEELEAANCIRSYEHQGRKYGLVRNFQKYQRPKKPNSVHFIPDQFRTYVAQNDPGSELDDPETVPSSEPKAPQKASVPPKSEKSPQMEDGGGRREEIRKIPPSPPNQDLNPPAANQHTPGKRLPDPKTGTPEEVVWAFYAIREEIYGSPWPSAYSPKEISIADGWLKQGNFDVIRSLFEKQMRRMYDRHQRPPGTMWFFNASVDEAIASDWRGYAA